MVLDMQVTSIGDALFTKTQQRVLGLLYGQPDRSFFANEIIRQVNMGRGTVRRELERLVDAGLLSVTRQGNQNHYQAKKDNPVYSELLGIVRKTLQHTVTPVSDEDRLVIGNTIVISRAALTRLARRYHINRLVLFGSAARGELTADSDIDLLVEFEGGHSPSLGGMVEINDDFVSLFNGRKVDIATPSILNNPYRKRAIENNMEELYAA